MSVSEPLNRRTLLCFSAGSVVEASVYAFCGLYLMNFYTDVVHLDSRLIGYAFSIRFLIDALSDPAVGFASDSARARCGKRRPYFLLGAIPASIAFYLLLTPPTGSEFRIFIYLTVVSSFLITSLTVFGIPYLAMSWELTSNYHDRTRISGYRRFMEVVAEIIASLTIPVVGAIAVASAASTTSPLIPNSEAAHFPMAAIVIGGIMVAAAAVTLFGIRGVPMQSPVPHESLWSGIRAAYRNRPFVLLLVTFTLVAVADRVATALLFYLLEHFHGVPGHAATPLLLAYFAGSLASPVVWMALSRHCGKKNTYVLAIVFWGAAFSSFAAVAWPGLSLYAVIAIMGAASSGVLILPGAIVPDVIEWEQAKTGVRREGVYAGLAKFSWKISTGVCFLLVGHLLFAVGYDGEACPDTSTLNGLRTIFVLLPGFLLVTAVFVFRKFPITSLEYRQLVRQIDQTPQASHNRQPLSPVT